MKKISTLSFKILRDKFAKPLAIGLCAIGLSAVIGWSACTEACRVSHNLSVEADNFNVTRRLSVINMRSDEPILELIGNFSISTTSTNELEVTVEVKKGIYKKHYVYLNAWTMYVVEDVSGAYVSPYHYEITFLPETIVPVEFTGDYD